MKIYTLVRTELFNTTQIWHFPTFALAQGKMLDICSNIVGEHCVLNTTMETSNGWNFVAGMDYATCSNGNKVEFEIFEEEINMREFMLHEIANYVCCMYADCNNYYNTILDCLDYFSIDCLPIMTDDEIKHFIDTELEERLTKRAAAKIVSGYDNDFQDKYFQVTADYLEGNRGLSVMLAVINGEEDAIEDVQKEINKEQGKDVFKMDYVWVCKSVWYDGTNFDRGENIMVYRSHDSAAAAMTKIYNEVIEVFSGQYIGEEITYWYDDDVYQVKMDDGGNYDLWEGTLTKQYIQD